MKPHVTWILVADAEKARIWVNLGPGKGLELHSKGDFSQETHKAEKIGSDKPGRAFESASTARHAYQPKIDLHRAEKRNFSKGVVDILNRGALEKSFERLILVAPPQLLGDIRQFLNEHAKARIVGELAKDLTHIPVRDLPGYIDRIVVV